MFFATRNAGRRIVRPAIVLPRKTNMRSNFRILRHPASPVAVEEAAKCLRRVRLRVWLLRIFGLGKREQREREGRDGNRQGKQHEQTNHYGFLPAAVVSSLSRSRASITIRRAVSAASIAV